jgi:hypothetical protein
MSSAVLMERVAEASPQLKARAAGFFWLMTFLTGSFAMFVPGRLVVTGDAAATAANILAHEPLFRLGFKANLIATLCYIAVTLLVYEMFKPVNRSLSLLAAFFSLGGYASGAVTFLCDHAPLVVLRGGQYLSVFTVKQLQALAFMFLRLSAQVSSIGLVFFGLHCLLIGYLILRSTFLPRLVGALMAFAGLSWLTYSFASLLLPPLARALSLYLLVPGLLGEGSLTLWLLVIGVNGQRWKEQASAAGGMAIVARHAPSLESLA